jgi:hypothetical protein
VERSCGKQFHYQIFTLPVDNPTIIHKVILMLKTSNTATKTASNRPRNYFFHKVINLSTLNSYDNKRETLKYVKEIQKNTILKIFLYTENLFNSILYIPFSCLCFTFLCRYGYLVTSTPLPCYVSMDTHKNLLRNVVFRWNKKFESPPLPYTYQQDVFARVLHPTWQNICEKNIVTFSLSIHFKLRTNPFVAFSSKL